MDETRAERQLGVHLALQRSSLAVLRNLDLATEQAAKDLYMLRWWIGIMHFNVHELNANDTVAILARALLDPSTFGASSTQFPAVEALQRIMATQLRIETANLSMLSQMKTTWLGLVAAWMTGSLMAIVMAMISTCSLEYPVRLMFTQSFQGYLNNVRTRLVERSTAELNTKLGQHVISGERAVLKSGISAGDIYGDRILQPSEMRLLTVQRTESPDSEIVSSLNTILQDGSKGRYVALSYCWGPDDLRWPMYVDGARILVRKTLDSALKASRAQQAREYPREDLVLWNDAICIKQGDDEEKPHQVRAIGDFYTNAREVWIFLEDPESLQESGSGSPAAKDLAMDFINNLRMESFDSYDASAPDPVWHHVWYLLRRAWWTRLWTIQEAVLGRQVKVIYGSRCIEFSRFVDLYQLYMTRFISDRAKFGDLRLFTFFPMGNTLATWSRLRTADTLRGQRQTPLLGRLITHSNVSCGLNVDRVFGLLGISDGHAMSLCGPDCQKSTEEVFLRASMIALLQQGTGNPRDPLMALRYKTVRHNSGEGGALRLPSWVSDWTVIPSPTVLGECYQADGGIAAWQRFFVQADNWQRPTDLATPLFALRLAGRSSLLGVRGIKADVISYAGNTPIDPAKYRAYQDHDLSNKRVYYYYDGLDRAKAAVALGSRLAAVKRAYKECYEHLRVANDPALKSPFWRTLVTDVASWSDQNRAPADHGDYLEQFLRDENAGERGSALETFNLTVANFAFGRRFIVTGQGRYGLAPYTAMEGDVVCVLFGAAVPFILRPSQRGDRYTLMGEAYVHDLMDGQAVRDPSVTNAQEFWIE